MRWPHYDDGLHVAQIASSGIERVPLEHSHTEQLPQFALGREELEIAFDEAAFVPKKQAVVQNAQGVDIAPKTTFKRARKWICAGLSVLAVVAIIVAVVVILKAKGHPQSVLGTNKGATTTAVSNPTMTTPGPTVITPSPTLSAPSDSATSEVGIMRPTSGAYNGTGMTALTPRSTTLQVVLYYQHWTGAIRTARLPFEGGWQPYDSTQDLLIQSGARNGTPLANAVWGTASATVNLLYLSTVFTLILTPANSGNFSMSTH